MRKRWIILGILGASVLLAAVLGRSMMRKLKGSQSARLRADFESADPAARLKAAREMLRADPTRPDPLIEQARALIELGRRDEARRELTPLTADEAFPRRADALRLFIDACLAESYEVASGTVAAGLDMVGDRIENLLERAAVARATLRAIPGNELEVLVFEAREDDVRQVLLVTTLRHQVFELAKAQATNFDDQAQVVGPAVSEMRDRLAALDTHLMPLCEQAISREPGDARPLVLMFRSHMRLGRVPQMRAVAKQISEAARVEHRHAGEIAGVLLNMERYAPGTTSDYDAAVARRLMTRGDLVGPRDVIFRLGWVALLLHDNKLDEAEREGRLLLNDADHHPRAYLLLSEAICRNGRPREAATLLRPFIERIHTFDGWSALGTASLSAGDAQMGRDQLRHALEIEPDNVPVRLAIAESLISTGAITDAEADIRLLTRLAPQNPRVRMAQVRLLVDKADAAGLASLLPPLVVEESRVFGWSDVAIIAAMVLDDMESLEALSAPRLAQRPGDSIALIAAMAGKSRPARRAEIAAALATALLELIDTQPLLRPDAPEIIALRRAAQLKAMDAGARSASVPVAPADAIETIFMPSPFETAHQLLAVAVDRWPAEPALRDLAAQSSLWLCRKDLAARHVKARLALGKPSSRALVAVASHLGLSAPPATAPVPEAPESAIHLWINLDKALTQGDDVAANKALDRLLSEHPAAEPALLMALCDAAVRGKPELVESRMEIGRVNAARTAALTHARWQVFQGRAQEAIDAVSEILRNEDRYSSVRRQSAEVTARAALMLARAEQAAGIFDALALPVGDQRAAMRIRAIDVRLVSGRTSPVVPDLTRMAAAPGASARAMDLILSRAEVAMEPPRLTGFLESLQAAEPQNAVIAYYRARRALADGAADVASRIAAEACRMSDDAPRAVLLLARALAAQGRVEDARTAYQKLAVTPGPAGDIAIKERDSLPPTTTTQPSATQGGRP